tara:strand:+ start:199 stop:363 length:165 start_codon:yes stop_codon:yes gene_type:complete
VGGADKAAGQNICPQRLALQQLFDQTRISAKMLEAGIAHIVNEQMAKDIGFYIV